MNIQAVEKISFKRIRNDHVYMLTMMTQDRLCVGTEHYQGLAYFWNGLYKHTLQDCTRTVWKKVHKAFVKAGLHPTAASAKHEGILNKMLGTNYIRY